MQPNRIKIAGPYRVPTKGMKFCRYDSMTTFYLDEGQLEWPHGECDTVPAFYIEVGDRAQVYARGDTQSRESFYDIALNLCTNWQRPNDANPLKQVRGKLIETHVPSDDLDTITAFNGGAEFVAQRHPSQHVRLNMIARLFGTYGTPAPSAEGRANVQALLRSMGVAT